jgi:hypothetical protein
MAFLTLQSRVLSDVSLRSNEKAAAASCKQRLDVTGNLPPGRAVGLGDEIE